MKVVYLPGYGTRGLVSTPTEIDEKVLVMTLDCGDEGETPLAMILPDHVLDLVEVPAMSKEKFKDKITAEGPGYTYPLIAKAGVDGNKEIVFKIAPIPPFVVYDAMLHQDLDAAVVLERILALDNNSTPALKHVQAFLCACLTGQNKDDGKPHISLEELVTPVGPTARRWAKNKFKTHFPTLTATPTTAPGTAEGGNPSMTEIIELILKNKESGGSAKHTDETKEGDPTSFGLSKMETSKLLQMCGCRPTDPPEK